MTDRRKSLSDTLVEAHLEGPLAKSGSSAWRVRRQWRKPTLNRVTRVVVLLLFQTFFCLLEGKDLIQIGDPLWS